MLLLEPIPPEAPASVVGSTMPHEVDLLSWVRELGPRALWPYDFHEAFVRAYWRASLRRQAEAARALPGLRTEMQVSRALLACVRRN
jgi:hypothetical protein